VIRSSSGASRDIARRLNWRISSLGLHEEPLIILVPLVSNRTQAPFSSFLQLRGYR
jgi:hypothetical protein